MYINDISIIYYLTVAILGFIVGKIVDWSSICMIDKKKIFCKEFFTVHLKENKTKYLYSIIMSIFYVAILYTSGITVKTVAFLILAPMLIFAFVIDYKEKIIPNRLNLTICEVGLVYTFIEGITNINVAINMLLGMLVGAGMFLIITLIGGLIAGKEAMGLGDVKFMGALGLFFRLAIYNINSTYGFSDRSN